MRNKTILTSSPQESIKQAFDANQNPGAYLVYIKCIGMPESEFISYHPADIKDGQLIIDEKQFPVALIETITVRCIQNVAPNNPIKVKFDIEYRLNPDAVKKILSPELQNVFQSTYHEKI